MLRIKRCAPLIFCCFIFIGAAEAGEIEIYFSPKGNCAEEIMQELSEAKETIDVAMYYFTARELAYKLVEMSSKGVKVRVYLDEEQETAGYSKSRFLINEGIPVRFESGSGLMHNKFCVIDAKTVITGSYNWTQKAEQQNDENVIILHNPDVAKIYQERFKKYWGDDTQAKEIRRNSIPEKTQKESGGQADKEAGIKENFFLSARPPLANFDIDAGEEFEDTEDDERETGGYKFLTTGVKLDQELSFRLNYSAGVKQKWKDYYTEKDRDNQSSTVFFDMNYRLAKPWTVSLGAEEEIKIYDSIEYNYNRLGLWTKLGFRQMPWDTYVKAGFSEKDYKEIDDNKRDISSEVGVSRYLFSKDSLLDVKYKFAVREYAQEGKDKIRQLVHVGVRHQF